MLVLHVRHPGRLLLVWLIKKCIGGGNMQRNLATAGPHEAAVVDLAVIII